MQYKNVNRKIFLFLIIFTVFSINTFSNDSMITVPDGYAGGEIGISAAFYNPQDNSDTITFSCEVKIKFLLNNSEILINVSNPGIRGLWLIGLGVIGNDIKAGYRYCAALKKGMFILDWLEEIKFTYNSPDTIWNNAVSYPDSISPIDTFYTTDSLEKGMFLYEGDVYCVSMYPDIYRHHANTYNNEPILYLCTGNNRKIKLQFNRFKIVKENDTDSGGVDSIYFNWAVDSSGNGKFMQFTPVTYHNNHKKEPAFSICKTGTGYFLMMKNVQPVKKRSSVTLYDIKGRKIFFQNIKNDSKIKIPAIMNGMYIICVSFDNFNIVKKIIPLK